eukprot:1978377-Rhodomonas_salina.1
MVIQPLMAPPLYTDAPGLFATVQRFPTSATVHRFPTVKGLQGRVCVSVCVYACQVPCPCAPHAVYAPFVVS